MSNPATVPDQAVELVAGFEGYRSKVYRDPGTHGVPWTQGYGSTRDENGKPFNAGSPDMDVARARALLQRDLVSSAATIATLVPVALSEAQRAALVSFIYNIGVAAFTTSTMLRFLKARIIGNKVIGKDGRSIASYTGAAGEFPRWNRGGGRVLPGLITRRAAEQKLFGAELPV